MVEAILLIILGVALLIATYRDIKTREVPDTLSYGLIVIGILGSLAIALLTSDLHLFLEHVAGFVAGALIGMLMFYTRQWGGGDAKLAMGVGAILGLWWDNLQFFEFLLLLIFCGAAYGIVVTLYLALVVNRKRFGPAFVKHLRSPTVHRLRIGLVMTAVLLFIAMIFVSWYTKIVFVFIICALYILIYSWVFMKVVEKDLMIKEYPIAKVTEGDWIVEEVKVGRKVIVSAKSTGVTLEQIAQMKKLKVKSVMVKEGIPFVPGFLLAFIVLLLAQRFFGGFLHYIL